VGDESYEQQSRDDDGVNDDGGAALRGAALAVDRGANAAEDAWAVHWQRRTCARRMSGMGGGAAWRAVLPGSQEENTPNMEDPVSNTTCSCWGGVPTLTLTKN
jgi:hypothetical protein